MEALVYIADKVNDNFDLTITHHIRITDITFSQIPTLHDESVGPGAQEIH
jgi:hypothetical protein